MSTFAASLAGIGRVNFNEGSASFFRFAGQHTKETRPGRVTNAFGKGVVVQHPVDVQILNRNSPELVYHLSAVLVREVGSMPPDALMHPGYNLSFGLTPWCAFNFFGKFALGLCQSRFFFSKETGVLNLLSVREGSKGFKANINTDLGRTRGQNLGFYSLTAKANIPFTCAAPGEGDGFRLAPQRSVQLNLDMPNLANYQHRAFQLNAGRGLGKGYAVIAAKPFEAGIARLLTGFNPTEEGLHGKVKPHSYILQDLGVDVGKGRTGQFKSREFTKLVILLWGFTTLFVAGFTLTKPVVKEPTAIFKLSIKQGFLLSGGPYSVFERLSHTNIISSFVQNCKLYTNVRLFKPPIGGMGSRLYILPINGRSFTRPVIK